MQDLDKSNQVKWLCDNIKNTAESYENDTHKIHFDYDSVINLLEQAQEIINESARCPRPDNLPSDMAWSERLYDGTDLDPYVYDGSMSIEDFQKISAAYGEHRQEESEDMER